MLVCAAPAVAQSRGEQGDSEHGNKCDSVSLDATPPSPQTVGVIVTLTATAAGCDNPQYVFLMRPPSGSWSQLQALSADPTATWKTAGLAAGIYSFAVAVRAGSSHDDWDDHTWAIVSYTLLAPVVCTGVAWNAPSPASPQTIGASVALSATAAGCTNPVYQFMVQPSGGPWAVLQAYSSSATATWDTRGLAAGTYSLDVWVRQAGGTADWEAHLPAAPAYTLQNPPQHCTSATWNAPVPSSPHAPGGQVTLSASAGGCTNPAYQFMVQPSGGQWSILQAYSAASTATWDTTGLASGTYSFDVWVRQADATADWEAHLSPSPTYDLQAPGPCTSVTWDTPVPASPQSPGTQVTLGGTSSGCSNPEYQFWIQAPGGTWTILQAYSPKSSVVWNTGGAATAAYLFDIWVRQQGSTADWEAHIAPNPTYTLQFGPPCTSVSVTFTPGSPLLSGGGTPVQLSAVPVGCPDATYEFWVQAPGGAWTLLQAYSTSSTATWDTTGLAPGTYLFDVWVKEAGNTPDWEAHISPNPTFTLS